MKPTIVFTGGGTAGHVIPSLALIEHLVHQYHIVYVGSKSGIERNMIEDLNMVYYSVQSGKLRRYWSWENFLDPFKLLIGIFQSMRLLSKLKPKLVFSKGGFVALPVVVGAWLNRIPVIAHESDLTPGLANRLSFPFVTKICVTFDLGKQYFKHQEKVIVTGTPIRSELFLGSRQKGLIQARFSGQKPCLLVMGGSLGAEIINRCVREQLSQLCDQFHVIHLCGKGKLDPTLSTHPDYYQQEFAHDDLPNLFAASDIILSRAGANSLYEILALTKPHVLIPLSNRYSRGDQIDNAAYFERKGVSVVLQDTESLGAEEVRNALITVYKRRDQIIQKMKALHIQSGTQTLVKLIEQEASA